MIALLLWIQTEDFSEVKKLHEAKEYAKALETLDAMKSTTPEARAWEIRLGAATRKWPRALDAVKAVKEPFSDKAVNAALTDVLNDLWQGGDAEGRAVFCRGMVETYGDALAHYWYVLAAVGIADLEGKADPAVKYVEKGVERVRAGAKTPEEVAGISMYEAYQAYVYWKCGVRDNVFSKKEAEPGTTFKDVTEARGLKGAGSGRVAVGDYDDDGFEDLWLGGAIWHNDGGKKFTRVSDVDAGGSGALWGDLDNDGLVDLVAFSQDGPRLLRNLGKGKFEEKPRLPKLEAGPEGNALVDVDGDGLLDVYIAVYEKWLDGQKVVGFPDKLYRNKGKFEFEDASLSSGISIPQYCGRGVAPADFDDDGDQDIFVANYRLMPDLLWRNDGKGAFTNVARELGVEGVGVESGGQKWYGHGIGAAWGDLDNDLDLDLVVGNLAHPRFITFSNKTGVFFNADGKFDDRFATCGMIYEETHSDASLVDIDNDGDLDCYLTSIYRERPSHLYQNKGDGTFEPIAWRSGAIHFDGWGHAWLDFDNDGDLDLIVCSGSHGTRLFENQLARKPYIRFKLEGKKFKDAVGARITVDGKGRKQMREIQIARGTTSQDSIVAHFGLGDYAGRPEVTIVWPGGAKEGFKAMAPNMTHKVKQK